MASNNEHDGFWHLLQSLRLYWHDERLPDETAAERKVTSSSQFAADKKGDADRENSGTTTDSEVKRRPSGVPDPDPNKSLAQTAPNSNGETADQGPQQHSNSSLRGEHDSAENKVPNGEPSKHVESETNRDPTSRLDEKTERSASNQHGERSSEGNAKDALSRKTDNKTSHGSHGNANGRCDDSTKDDEVDGKKKHGDADDDMRNQVDDDEKTRCKANDSKEKDHPKDQTHGRQPKTGGTGEKVSDGAGSSKDTDDHKTDSNKADNTTLSNAAKSENEKVGCKTTTSNPHKSDAISEEVSKQHLAEKSDVHENGDKSESKRQKDGADLAKPEKDKKSELDTKDSGGVQNRDSDGKQLEGHKDDINDPNTDSKTDEKAENKKADTKNSESHTSPKDDATPVKPDFSDADMNSPSLKKWIEQRTDDGPENDVVDEIMRLVGLEKVKEKVLRIRAAIQTAIKQGSDPSKDAFSTILLGNPGTGKSTFARLYGKFLAKMKVVPGEGFVEKLAAEVLHVSGIKATATALADLASTGGVFFVDDAHGLLQYSGNTQHLLGEIERYRGKIVFIFAGYTKEMEKLASFNPSVRTRIPYNIEFDDHSDGDMHGIFARLIRKRFGEKEVRVEGGIEGLHARVLVRRLCLQRKDTGAIFRNARLIEDEMVQVYERQACRLLQERADGKQELDYYSLAKEDLTGPEPEDALRKSKAWKELDALVGLESVKEGILALYHRARSNYECELEDREPVPINLNQVFLGPPGTGKTTVAKLYAQILTDLRLVSRGKVMVKNPSDFIGRYLGQTEANTRDILEAAVGNVLIIDEAHMLYTGNSRGYSTDSYRAALIDTLVAKTESKPGEDRAIILVGYPEPVEDLFQHCNQGLSRRFPLAEAFRFGNFSLDHLGAILDQKAKADGIELGGLARQVAMQTLDLARDRPHFGNGGEVDNMLGRAKMSLQRRTMLERTAGTSEGKIFQPQDFDPEHVRLIHVGKSCRTLFHDFVGGEEMIGQFERYQQTVAGMRRYKVDPRPHIPFSFIFKGPPGTGKTTTARKVGQIFYDMGFLAAPTVVECSVSDLTGKFVGEAGSKVVDVMEKALGRVLFIDEAYRLGVGQYGKDAANELVDCMTKKQYAHKLVIILAGYEDDMNDLMSINQGLASRFPTEIYFQNMPPEDCVQLLRLRLAEFQVHAHGLEDAAGKGNRTLEIMRLFANLSATPSWGNGRDVETLAKVLISHAFQINYQQHAGLVLTKDELEAGPGILSVTFEDLASIMSRMLERKRGHGGARYKLPTHSRPSPALDISEHIDTLTTYAVNKLDRPPVRADQRKAKRRIAHGYHEI